MDDVVYRLTWFEVQVCPFEFRLALAPGQPVLIGFGGEGGATTLIPYANNEALVENIIGDLDHLLRECRAIETEMRRPERAFEDEAALARPSLHLRFAYGDDRRWASMWPLSKVPHNIRWLLENVQDMARWYLEANQTEEASYEAADALLHPPADAVVPNPPAVIAKVEVTRTGAVFLNDRPTTLEELVGVFARLKEEDGGVWYHREDPSSEGPEEASAVFEAILDAGLPVALCEDDFDVQGGQGQRIFLRPQS